MSGSDGSWLAELVGNVYRYRKVLYERLKKAAKNGSVYVLLSVFLFSIAAAFVSVELIRDMQFDKDTGNVLRRIVTSKHEPRRDEEHIGLVASVLTSFDELNFKEQFSQDSIPKVVRNYLDSFQENVMDLNWQKQNVIVKRIEPLEGPKEIFGHLRPGVLVSSTNSRFLIPPSQSNCSDQFREMSYLGAKTPGELYTLVSGTGCPIEGVIDKQSFEVAMSLMTFKGLKSSEGIIQAYFITPSGLFSHVAASEYSEFLDISKNKPMYRFEAANYFQVFLDNRAGGELGDYSTAAYLDLTGAGIIRTHCKLIVDRSGCNVGVLCVDEQIPLKRILNSERYKELVKKGSVDWSNSVFNFTLYRLDLERFPADFSTVSHLDEIEKYVDSKKSGLYDYTVRNLGGLFMVPISREGKYEHLLYIERRHFQLVYRLGWQLVLAMVFVFFSFKYLMKGVKLTASLNERSRLATILRNLPVGVVEYGEIDAETDRIQFQYVNDHAEEIIEEKLVRFGQNDFDLGEGKFFRDVFHDEAITEHSKGGYVRVNLRDIAMLRKKKGMTSTYYIKVKERDGEDEKWVKMIGTPLMDVGAKEPRSFAVFYTVKRSDVPIVIDNVNG